MEGKSREWGGYSRVVIAPLRQFGSKEFTSQHTILTVSLFPSPLLDEDYSSPNLLHISSGTTNCLQSAHSPIPKFHFSSVPHLARFDCHCPHSFRACAITLLSRTYLLICLSVSLITWKFSPIIHFLQTLIWSLPSLRLNGSNCDVISSSKPKVGRLPE